MKKAAILTLGPYLAVFTLLTVFSLHMPFFWDSIQLGSRQAGFFLNAGYHSLILPNEIDSGHFPLFGLYLSIIWNFFGENIPVSHIALLPILLGLCFQYYKLAIKFIKPGYIHFAMLLLVADPVVLSQSTMVGPDIVLLFLFLASVNLLLENRKWLYAITIGFLALISMRGMMTVFGLFLFEILVSLVKKERLRIGIITKYIPAGLLSLSWLMYHYKETGWIGYYPGSTWAACFVRVPPMGVLKNIVILFWRLLDFGRVFVWLLGLICFIKAFRNSKEGEKGSLTLVTLFIVILAVYIPSFILYAGLGAHRYLMPCMVLVGLGSVYFMQMANPGKLKNISFILVFIGLVSGNFWVYPGGVSEGWDATLAHVPYFELRKQMITYINENHIDPKTVGTAFPNIDGTRYSDLNSTIGPFKHYDLSKDKYIFQSNIFNDFHTQQIDSLKQYWTLKQEYRRCGIYVRLYSH